MLIAPFFLLGVQMAPALTGAARAVSSRMATPPVVRLSPARMFILAEAADASGDDRLVKAIYQALEHDPNVDVRAEARYRQAMRLARLNRPRDAAILLRRVVDEKPGAAPARLQLATMLHRLGDEDAALRELRALRSADLPLVVTRFVDRFAASLRANKPFTLQVEVALAPDSNINHATRAETLNTVLGDFTLAPDARPRSGIGAAVRTTAQSRLAVSDTVHWVSRVSTDANLYRDRDFNDVNVEVASGPELAFGQTRLGLEAAVGQEWYAMSPYQRSLRLSGSVSRPLDSVSQLRLDGGVRRSNYRTNDLQDGHGLSLRARYERAVSPQMLLAANFGLDRLKARDDAYSNRSWSAGITAYRDVGRMSLFAGVQIGRLTADDRLSLLPEARKDKSFRFSAGAVFRRLSVAGFAPIARLIVERNRSNLMFYDIKRTRTEFGISRAF